MLLPVSKLDIGVLLSFDHLRYAVVVVELDEREVTRPLQIVEVHGRCPLEHFPLLVPEQTRPHDRLVLGRASVTWEQERLGRNEITVDHRWAVANSEVGLADGFSTQHFLHVLTGEESLVPANLEERKS